MSTKHPSYDALVLGLGAMGSAALYQLSKQGTSVLGIDQFTPPHIFGSTHGDTRITRQAIGEGEAYTPLALRSYDIWNEIEKASGVALLTITGGLILASPDTASMAHGNVDFMGNTLRSAERYHIPHETLKANEIRTRYPQFKLRGNETGYLEEKAGFLRPERCVEANLTLAQRNGAAVHVGEKAISFSQEAVGVLVTTDRGVYRAKKLILTAGPWVSEFLPAAYKQCFQVYRQVLYWFDIADNYAAFKPDIFPIFIWDFGTKDGEAIYGFPAIDGKHGGLKVAHEQYQVTTNPSQANREVSAEETQEMYERFVAPRLSGVSGKCLKAVTCLYTVTPDSGFVIDVHPHHKDVLIASPCSGHGFKHSAAIGESLAQWAIQGHSEIDISAFSLKRLG